MKSKELTKNQLRRLPTYLHLLRDLKSNGVDFITCQTIADDLELNKEQVRKDIALISSIDGVPNRGRDIDILIKDVETILGYRTITNAVIVGVGSLGRALLAYKGFENYGLNIVAAFDLYGDKEINGKHVYGMNKLTKETLKKLNAEIGIITVPDSAAQEVADKLVDAKVQGIWNFAPSKINVPKNIILSNIDLAASLAVLSHELYLKEIKEKKNG